MSSFTEDINIDIDKIGKKADYAIGISMIRAHRYAGNVSPVDTGQLRSWWYVDNDGSGFSTEERKRPYLHKRGNDIFSTQYLSSIARAKSAARSFTIMSGNASVVIGNNISYFEDIDSRYGLSKKVQLKLKASLEREVRRV